MYQAGFKDTFGSLLNIFFLFGKLNNNARSGAYLASEQAEPRLGQGVTTQRFG